MHTVCYCQLARIIMTKPNHPIALYLSLEYVPLGVLALIISVLLPVLHCTVLKCKCCIKVISSLAKVALGPPVGIFSYKGQDKESEDVYINDKKVPDSVLVVLGYYVMASIGFIVMVFWAIFLVQESYVCDDESIDCFVSTRGSPKLEPITDCSDYKDNKNVVITCYTFVYRFGAAFAAAGGMITLLKVMTKIVSAIFLKIYARDCNCLCTKCTVAKKCCYNRAEKECFCCCSHLQCIAITHFVINIIITLLCYSVFYLVTYFIPVSVELYPSSILKSMWLFFGYIVLSWIPWGYFSFDDENKEEGCTTGMLLHT